MGETAVRKKLAEGGWNASQIPLVNDWLEHQGSLRKDEENSPAVREARSARRAAWVAAIAAIIAVIVAAVSAYHSWAPHP
jgi:hypothetical protein